MRSIFLDAFRRLAAEQSEGALRFIGGMLHCQILF